MSFFELRGLCVADFRHLLDQGLEIGELTRECDSGGLCQTSTNTEPCFELTALIGLPSRPIDAERRRTLRRYIFLSDIGLRRGNVLTSRSKLVEIDLFRLQVVFDVLGYRPNDVVAKLGIDFHRVFATAPHLVHHVLGFRQMIRDVGDKAFDDLPTRLLYVQGCQDFRDVDGLTQTSERFTELIIRDHRVWRYLVLFGDSCLQGLHEILGSLLAVLRLLRALEDGRDLLPKPCERFLDRVNHAGDDALLSLCLFFQRKDEVLVRDALHRHHLGEDTIVVLVVACQRFAVQLSCLQHGSTISEAGSVLSCFQHSHLSEHTVNLSIDLCDGFHHQLKVVTEDIVELQVDAVDILTVEDAFICKQVHGYSFFSPGISSTLIFRASELRTI